MYLHSTPSDQIDDPLDKVQEIYRQTRDKLEKAKKVVDTAEKVVRIWRALTKLKELEKAADKWRSDPEDISKGINFANKTAGVIGDLDILVPKNALSVPVVEYLTGLIKAVPRYVKVLGGLLEKRIQAIDAVGAAGRVDYDAKTGCDHGLVRRNHVQFIKSLELDDESKKEAIFKWACGFGFSEAIRKARRMGWIAWPS